jgi:hypothetical protein
VVGDAIRFFGGSSLEPDFRNKNVKSFLGYLFQMYITRAGEYENSLAVVCVRAVDSA